ncbi:MAG TPA: hypothetical protein VL997_11870, partial [Dyella sp.]|nr:hypothetical protein [Dyella sp.]
GYDLMELTAAQYAQFPAYDYQPSCFLLNAGATWLSPGGIFRVTAYGRNLSNKMIKSEINLNQDTFLVVPGEPRVFGVAISVHF